MALAPSSSTLPPSAAGLSRSMNAKISQPASKPAPTVDLPSLQSASRVLQDQLVKDAQAVPELGDMLTIPGMPSSASYNVNPSDIGSPYQKRRFIHIPEGLFKYYETVDCTTHMGLMPEIERVWVTVDNNLLLWNYLEGEELSSYTEQPDVITNVALVKPKPGVFIDEITSLLVICTPVSVLLLGLSTSVVPAAHNRSRKELKLYATDMSISSEVEMTSVVGTPDGRIFMCGSQDGNLYEFHYQEKEGWFGKRVQLINHSVGGVQSLLPRLAAGKAEDRIVYLVADSARNCFYTLTTNNTISIYRTNGDKAVQHVQTLSNLYKAAQDKAPGSPAITPASFRINSLHVIEPGNSQNSPHLMAITGNGLRFFFAPSTGGYNYGYGFSGGPSTGGPQRALQLVHVRLPPSNLLHPDEQTHLQNHAIPTYGSAHLNQDQPSRAYVVKNLQYACYEAGLTIASQPSDTSNDYILCISPDLTQIGSFGQVHGTQMPPIPQYSGAYGPTAGPSRPPLTEKAEVIPVNGMVWDMALMPRSPLAAAAQSPPDSPAPVVINELATQFSEPPKTFMILTNIGITILPKLRAVDDLKDVIRAFQAEGNAQTLIHFRDSFGRDQTCAMLLALASGNTFLDIDNQSNLGTISAVSPDVAAVAKQAFYDFGERPTWTERVTYGTSADAAGTATFSGRREGLALYFARLVRPLWKAKLTKPGPAGQQQPNVADDVLVVVQRNLQALKDLLDKNPHLFHSAPGDYTGARSASANEQEAWKAEQSSVSQLLNLLGRTIEAISFVLLLTDHRIGELISQCDSSVQQMVKTLTFEQLITTQEGVTASRALVNVVINQQIGQQISVDTISEILQQRCGSFCSTDDVLLYKAKENVRKAVETRNPAERQKWLAESLRLFMKGARILEFDKLREICGDFQHLNYAKGAIELPLYCALVMDADGQGQEYWAAGLPPNDPREEAWQRRSHCYDLILDSLGVFDEQASTAKQPQPTVDLDDPDGVRTHAYELAFGSEDEIFHSKLYDWLIQKGLADELLEMRPAYLEAHLRREPVTVQKYQLLWQFYVKDGQPLRAAEVLGALADSPEFDIPLETRVEYLTLAVGNAKSHPVSAGGRHETAIAFLTDLEEKLDVAQVQLEIYNTLASRANEPGETGMKIQKLSKTLLNITELYQYYAEPFDLPIMKLLIFHISGHKDDNLVRPIWNKIFEEALADVEPKVGADQLISKIIPLGHRFYPSDYAFPLRHIASLLVRFSLSNKGLLPYGWAPRILIQCGAPYHEVWDIFHEMYESQIPPFNDQANVQAVSSDIAVLLTDWLEEAKRPQSPASRGEFPVYRIDQAIDQYLAELGQGRTETKTAYESVKRQLRRNW